MVKTLMFYVIAFLIIIIPYDKAFPYDDIDTHPRITEQASSKMSSTLDSYLRNNLGYGAGLQTQFSTNGMVLSTKDWLKQGSKTEDSPLCRASNHFHNPLQSWNFSYMTDFLAANAGCLAQGWIPTYSAVTWATGFLSPAPSGTKATFTANPDTAPYTWDKARDSYYKALTSTTNLQPPFPPGRDYYFAQTFSTLGHVMHLLQDMAVPAHTRNDFQSHLMLNPVNGNMKTLWTSQPYENYVKINTSLVNFANPTGNYPAFSTPSVTNFWDTDQYDGSNPSGSTAIGLAEYANANFFSDFTIFKGILDLPHSFPYPASSSVQTYEEIIDSGTGKSRTYLKKVGNGETVNHLAAYGLYFRHLPAAVNNLALYLDDKCHDDYAKKLLPRAVGYSAGLLNYFFRGTIDITVPSNGIYSMIDATQPGFNPATATFTAIKLQATNTTTTGENMTNGTIQLVVKYKVAQTDPFVSGPVATTSSDFTYRVFPEQNNVSALYSATPTELNFDLSQNPIPLWATDVYLQVVFKGTLGTEANAVAVGFNDISEPTPIDFTNNMDKICINGSWYDAGSTAAIDQVDTNHDDIANEVDVYAHDKGIFYVKFEPYSTTQNDIWASPTAYDFKVLSLTAGNHIRASYILSDYQFNYSIYNRAHVKNDPADTWTDYDYLNGWIRTAIKRQKDYTEDGGLCGGLPSCYIDRYPEYSANYPADGASVFYNFRGISLYWGGQLITINYPYPLDSQCSYDLL